MVKGAGKLFTAPSSRLGLVLLVPFGLVGIASLIVLLAMQSGLVGALAGIALVGLSSVVTTRLVGYAPDQPRLMAVPVAHTPGWLKLLNVGTEVWLELMGQTNTSSPLPEARPASASPLLASQRAIAMLQAVPGMTTAHARDFKRSEPFARLQDGTIVKRWKNPVGVEHVFLADDEDQMLYGGFVGWVHTPGLQQAVTQIKRELT